MSQRPRCVACGHPLTSPRSLARAFGPVCWTRTRLSQLDERRDAVGRSLARLAALVAALDATALDAVAVAVNDALDAAGGAR